MIDKKNELTSNVNVTMHKTSFSSKGIVYARVQRDSR